VSSSWDEMVYWRVDQRECALSCRGIGVKNIKSGFWKEGEVRYGLTIKLFPRVGRFFHKAPRV
jgi:hypothetical protein